MGLIEDTPVPISQYEKEFEFLLRIYEQRQPQRVLEIGTHYGGTLYHWITKAYSPKTRVDAVDNQHINKNLYAQWAEKGAAIYYFLGDSKSAEAFNWMQEGNPYDFIFIDGDHSFSGVQWDWINATMLAGRNSVIAFHDITPHPNREVDLLWEQIKGTSKNWEEVIDTSYPENERCGIGIIYLD